MSLLTCWPHHPRDSPASRERAFFHWLILWVACKIPVSASHGATGRFCGRLDPFPEPPPPHTPGFINGVCKGSVSSWGRYDDHRLAGRLAHRDDLINVDIERLSDKVGAGPEEGADAVFRWIEQYYDLGLSNAGNLRSTLDPDILRLVYYALQVAFPAAATLIGLEIRRLFLRFRPQRKTWRSGNSCSEPNGTAAIDPSPAALGYLCYFSRLAALSQASRSDPCILMMRCASDVAMPCFSANVATWYGSRPENPGSALPRRGLWFDTTASLLRGRRTGDCISPPHTLLLLQAAVAILDLRT